MGISGSRASKAEEERASKRKSEKQNVCPIHSPYCKLPSRPPWNSSLSWRCLENCGAKKENQCLLSLYSICVFIILLLQIAAIVFINVDDANIDFIKKSISEEAGKIDIDVEKLQPGSKFVQNLFFGVSAGLSAIILFFTVTLCCRARREERVQGYVDAIQA